MPLSSLLLFASVYALAVASPGPGIAALIARVLARGSGGIAAFIVGFVVGDLTWFAVAAAGFAVIAKSIAPIFVVVKYAGALYLAWLGWRSRTAPTTGTEAPPPRGEGPARLFLTSLGLTLGNPKVILFFLALLPTVVDLDHLGALGFAELAGTIVVMLSAILSAYALAAARVRRLLISPRARRAVNRTSGAVMLGAAVAVATR